MSIPNGYRLLNESDIGKTFKVDLEPLVYFDTSVKPYTSLPKFPTTDGTINEITLVGTSTQTDKTVITLQVFRGLNSTYVGFFLYIANESGSSNSVYTYGKAAGTDEWTKESQVLPQYTISSLEFTTQFPNNWFYVKDINPKVKFTNDMHNLAASIVNKAGSSGNKTIKEMKSLVDGLKTEFVTQEKTVTPTKSSQSITPDSGKDGLSKVTVNAIPDEYIVPSGSLIITENGTHDVTSKASVLVNVPVPFIEQWDGSYKEIVNGFIATFAETYAGPYDIVSFYSLDNGLTWDNANRFAYNEVEMEDVVQIKFKVTYEYIEGYEQDAGGRVVCEELGVDIEATSSNREIITDNFILTQNINVSMGSAD